MCVYFVGQDFVIIGEVIELNYNRVLVKIYFGGECILDMLVGE